MSNSLRSLTKHEQMSESLIRSFFRKKRAIRSQNRWVDSQLWVLEEPDQKGQS